MGILAKIEKFLDGHKTYIVSLLVGLGGIWQSTGHVIPDYVWTILAAAGLGAVRSAIGNGGNVKPS